MVNNQETFELSLESLGLKLRECVPEKNEAESHESQCLKKNVVFISDASNNETGSIVVLGENLLYKIQTQALARYKLIYQKSLSVDDKSEISDLTNLELQQKLSDLSQENFRLKQALENNALSMKYALNIIASKQAELMNAHDARKQKVADIKHLLHVLKKEAGEYESKITSQNKDFDHAAEQVEQVPQQMGDSPIKFVRLIEELQALGDCCAIDMYSRFKNISDGVHRCGKIVAEQRNAREIEESLRLLESSIEAELMYLRSMLVRRMTKNKGEPEGKTEFEMEMEKIVSSYNSKLQEIKYLREANDPSTALQTNENVDQRNASTTIVSLREPETSLEEAQLSLEEVTSYLMQKEHQINCERIRMQSKERQLIEANVNLHEEIDRLRESINVLRVQLTVYENDWAEQNKACDIMRKKENELLDHIRKLEEEKTQWLSAMQCFQQKRH